MVWIRWLVLSLLLLAGPSLAAPPVVVLELTGPIGPASSDYIGRALRTPAAQEAQAIVLRIDTPGGLDSAMRDIIQVIIGSNVPIVAYVAPGGARAASAGTYILYASHIAAMAPGTNLGAATPVQLGGLPGGAPEQERPPEQEGEQQESQPAQPATAMERKMLNDAVAYIRSLAALRGRNADWAERAVREAASLGAEDALQLGVIDLVAEDLDGLLEALHGRTVTAGATELTLATAEAEVIRLEPDWRSRLLAVITNPNVAYVLMLIGIYGLIFELMNPGSLVPGVLGGIALLLALYAFQALPISYAGLGLILLGMAFMIAEAFAASFGILGIGGVIAFVVGSIMLFDTDTPAFQLSLQLVAGFAIVSLLLLIGVITMLLRSRRRPLASGADTLIGSQAEALYDFTGQGQVRLRGEIWSVFSDVPIAKHQPVRVTARDGLRLRVEQISSQADHPGDS